MSERFYTSAPLVPGEFVLSGAEAHHITTVRRFSDGDRITLFNGSGAEYTAEILGVSKNAVTLNVTASGVVDRELPFPLVVASAIPKGDRAEFMVEKLTELGVSRFVPLITSRSVVIPRDSTVAKFARTVIEASKQCGRNRLMAVDPPQRWTSFVDRDDLPAMRFLMHTTGTDGSALATQTGTVVAIGPEGGFTTEEVESAVLKGWRTASLGSRVLRVETAAIAAAAILGTSTG